MEGYRDLIIFKYDKIKRNLIDNQFTWLVTVSAMSKINHSSFDIYNVVLNNRTSFKEFYKKIGYEPRYDKKRFE